MNEQGLRDEIIHFGVIAADFEALATPPPSRVRNPDGSMQSETGAEYTRRLVGTAIGHLIDVGLLEITADAERRMRDEGIPISPRWVRP